MPSNFLLLDEPTNHLDASSRDVLQEALEEYDGSYCIVSHDRDFVAPLCDFVLEIIPGAGGARVEHVLGGYEDYLARKLREAAESVRGGREPIKKEAAAKAAPSGPSNNKLRAWKSEFEKLEKEIAQLETEQKELETKLGLDTTYEDKDGAMKLVARQTEVTTSLETKLARWAELAEFLEAK